jgi:gliding motility-associated-like protein
MKKLTLLFFSLLLNIISYSQCAGDITYDLSIPPAADGTYPPNTVVELCVTMTNWNGNAQGSNWMEGFGLTLGAGWTIVTPITPPNDADGDASGTWIWVESVTSDATGLTAGPGYFFEGPTGPTDGNPGNDWGDYCMNGDCVWTFCAELTSSGVSGESLDIGVTPYSDGSMGSWGTEMCFDEITEIIDSEVGCNTYGCTDPTACNYDANAACDDGSCLMPGCTDPVACNYDLNAPCDDGSCTYGGCTDPLACNFDPLAGCDDGSCGYFSMGDITHNLIPCPDTVCTGLDVNYSVTGNPTSIYDWNIDGPGSQLSTIITDQTNDCVINWGDIPGSYTISVQEITPQGCEGVIKTCNVEVVVPDITFPINYRICYNQTVELDALPLGGVWSGQNVSGNTFIGYQPGDNLVTYTINYYGCEYSENVLVYVEPLYDAPGIVFTKEILDLCTDPSEQLYTAIDDRSLTYVWSIDNSIVPTIENTLNFTWYDTTNTYLIQVYGIDEIGCESQKTLFNIHTDACQRLFAPNSFTPNGDGLNDIFKISGLSIHDPTLRIFDRWGIQIYTANVLYWTGDGGNGYYCSSDVYNWSVEYRDKNGTNQNDKGFVTLIR